MTMELRLLHSVFNKEIYDGVKDVFTAASFSDELEDIATVVSDCHDQFAGDLDLSLIHI